MEKGGKGLWDIFLESSLSTYGIGGNRFKNPLMWALLTKVDETLGDTNDKVVFDVGCGTGIKSILLALKGARVRGFDADQRAIDNCHKNLAKIGTPVDVEFSVLDVQKRFPAEYHGKVDFIFCNQVIEHIQDYERALDAMIRVLKRGGKIFITTPNKLARRLKRSEKVFGEKELGHHHSFSREDLMNAIKKKRNVKTEELTTHQTMPALTIRMLYKIISKLNEFQWFLQIVDERHGGRTLERTYVTLTRLLVALHNSLVYPHILNSHLDGERKITDDEGLTIYLTLKKL